MISSALRGFEGIGGGGAFGASPSMYQIGYQGGPGGNIADAMKYTLDKYDAARAGSVEQANKLEQIGATADAGY
jgi:hypothetical protein